MGALKSMVMTGWTSVTSLSVIIVTEPVSAASCSRVSLPTCQRPTCATQSESE